MLESYKLKYPILLDTYLIFTEKTNKFDFFGRSNIDTIGNYIVNGKNRYKNIKTISIELVVGYDNILYTLLHEITHCTIQYRERKIKNDWIILSHGDDFYKKYVEIIDYAYTLKIINTKYTIDEIKKFDNNWYLIYFIYYYIYYFIHIQIYS